MLRRLRFVLTALWLTLALTPAQAQQGEQTPATTPPANGQPQVPDSLKVGLSNVDVLPGSIDTRNWLLLDKDIQLELGGAVDNVYNFKYDKAAKQFRSLRRRYPEHPMPYFLLALNEWWKIVPTNIQTKEFDKSFFAYLDTAVYYGERMWKKDKRNYEAAFFLSAAYGFDARLNSERANWRKATVSSRRSLEYMQKASEANGLSAEFMFGSGLFNYYAVWISENYPLLRPVLIFFPKGNKRLGLQQLKNVAENGFYTGTEAKFFLMKIYQNEENKPDEAKPIAKFLATNYPDNAYFERFYARLAFAEGDFKTAERLSNDIMDKIKRRLPGYEAISGRYATYYLGFLQQHKYKKLDKAKEYYKQCIEYAKETGEEDSGYYQYANINLAHISDQQGDVEGAVTYYNEVLDVAEKKSDAYREAKDYVKNAKKLLKNRARGA